MTFISVTQLTQMEQNNLIEQMMLESKMTFLFLPSCYMATTLPQHRGAMVSGHRQSGAQTPV